VRSGASSNETVLPAEYVADHVELGYAVTAHRCQGMTVDTTHTIATNRMTREAFYVALTRGSVSNRAYITTDLVGSGDRAFGPECSDREDILTAIIARTGSEPAARTTQVRAGWLSEYQRPNTPDHLAGTNSTSTSRNDPVPWANGLDDFNSRPLKRGQTGARPDVPFASGPSLSQGRDGPAR
jgi:hypothetical protein